MKTLQPVTLMYFWLNYCDENHIERIPVAVKNIDQLFHLASEIIGVDRLHLVFTYALNKRKEFQTSKEHIN